MASSDLRNSAQTAAQTQAMFEQLQEFLRRQAALYSTDQDRGGATSIPQQQQQQQQQQPEAAAKGIGASSSSAPVGGHYTHTNSYLNGGSGGFSVPSAAAMRGYIPQPMPAPSYQFQPLLLPPGFTFPPALDGDRTKLSYATTTTGLPDVTTSASTAAVVPVAAGIANDDRYVTKQEFVAFQKSTTALLEQILQKLSLNTPATPPTGPIISGGGAADSPSGVGPDVPQQQSTQPPAPSLRPGTATTIGTGDVHRPLRTTTAPSENLTTAPNNSRSNHVDNDKLGNNVPNGTAGSHSSNNNNSNNNNKNNNDSTCISVLNEDEYLRIHMDRWTIDTTSYHWWISDWSNLPRRAKSPIFSCGGHDWRIVHRPTGSSHSGTASLFLECTNDKTDASKWPVLAQFILTISNVTDPTVSTHGSAFHCFRPLSCNWGFTRFQTVADLTVGSTRDGLPPIIENDRCIISAFIRVLKLPSGINDDIRQPASQERRPMSARRSSYSTS